MTKPKINTALLAQAIESSVGKQLIRSRKADRIARKLLADDGDGEASDRGKLKVLNDGDGVRLLMNIYQDYVSDDDYVKFPTFMYDVDTLLYKARGNRTLTREERQEMEESTAPKKKLGKKKKPAPAPVDTPPAPPAEVTASDNSEMFASFFTNFINKQRAEA